jgi:hypothetical protein
MNSRELRPGLTWSRSLISSSRWIVVGFMFVFKMFSQALGVGFVSGFFVEKLVRQHDVRFASRDQRFGQ